MRPLAPGERDGDLVEVLHPVREAPGDRLEEAAAVVAPLPVETVVVTARVSAPLATKLVQRAAAGGGASVVWVDSASFAGRPAGTQPELLRLQAAGIPVAVVREGDDLGRALGAQARSAVG